MIKLFASLLACAVLASTHAETLVITTEQYPPFNVSNDDGHTIEGISTDVVREMARRANVDIRISLYPWARAYHMALEQAHSCVYSTTRTEQREHLFKWIGPLVENPWVLYARDDNKLKIERLEDAKPYLIGGYLEDAVAVYLKQQGYRVDEASNDRANPKKLAAGHIDFWATGKYLGVYNAQLEGVGNIHPILTFKQTQMYLACNLHLSDTTVAQLNTALQAIERDGTMQKIQSKYQ